MSDAVHVREQCRESECGVSFQPGASVVADRRSDNVPSRIALDTCLSLLDRAETRGGIY